MTRLTNHGRRRKCARPTLEVLEDRITPTWAAVPPATITTPFSPTVVSLNYQGDAAGDNWINGEVDYYRFVAPAAATYRFTTATPTGPLDTVLAVYDAAGKRLAYSNDALGTTDSDATVALAAGKTYLLGVTNLAGTAGGGYKWKIDGPVNDDPYEHNDVRAGASDLGTPTGRFLAANLVMNDEADWYRFTMGPGGSGDRVRIAFSNAQGDLGLRLYNAAGALVGSSLGAGDSETISLAGLAAGTYYAQVTGTQLLGTPYSLEVSLADDRYEQNDTRATAADLGSLSAKFIAANLVMNDSADWYKFTTGAMGSDDAYLKIAFSNAKGDLDLRLYDAAGKQVRESLGGGDVEQTSLAGLPAGTYYALVYGWQSLNPSYSLEIMPPLVEDEYDLRQRNDTRLTASSPPIYDGVFRGTMYRLVMNDAADWYRFPMPLVGGAHNYVRIAFDTSEGDLGLRVYDAAGTLVGSSLGSGNKETVSLKGLPAGTFFVQVTAAKVLGTRYTLEVEPGIDDYAEDNDAPYLATPSGGSGRVVTPGLVMADSADWFVVRMQDTGTQAHYVRATFSQAEGDLELCLYDSLGTSKRIAATTGGAGWDQISLAGQPGGTYYLQVTARQGTNFRYDLEFVTPYRDDGREDNDTLQTANDLGLQAASGAGASLAIGGLQLVDAADWYRFTLPGPVPGPADVKVTYAGAAVVQLGLYDAGGKLLRSGTSSAGAAALSMAGFGAGTYYLKVTERDGKNVFNYRLEVPSGMQDDRYEENDTRATASDLGLLYGRFIAANLGMNDAADWYRFTTAGPGTADNYVRIAFLNAQGDLDLRLYNAAGGTVSASTGGGDGEQVSLAGLAAGTYYVQVYGWQSFNPSYSLEIAPGLADDS